MTIVLQRGDIADVTADVIVNAANESLIAGGGVDGALHDAAGPRLQEACLSIAELKPGLRCPTGDAVVTPAFQLDAEFVVHAVGPVWRGGGHDEEGLLRRACRRALQLCDEHNAEAVAMPAISCGAFGFPAHLAAGVLVGEARSALKSSENLRRITFVIDDDEVEDAFRERLEHG